MIPYPCEAHNNKHIIPCGNCAHRHAPKWYCTSVPHIYGEGGVHHIGLIERVLVAVFGCPYWWK